MHSEKQCPQSNFQDYNKFFLKGNYNVQVFKTIKMNSFTEKFTKEPDNLKRTELINKLTLLPQLRKLSQHHLRNINKLQLNEEGINQYQTNDNSSFAFSKFNIPKNVGPIIPKFIKIQGNKIQFQSKISNNNSSKNIANNNSQSNKNEMCSLSERTIENQILENPMKGSLLSDNSRNRTIYLFSLLYKNLYLADRKKKRNLLIKNINKELISQKSKKFLSSEYYSNNFCLKPFNNSSQRKIKYKDLIDLQENIKKVILKESRKNTNKIQRQNKTNHLRKASERTVCTRKQDLNQLFSSIENRIHQKRNMLYK